MDLKIEHVFSYLKELSSLVGITKEGCFRLGLVRITESDDQLQKVLENFLDGQIHFGGVSEMRTV